jgi:hypothetical protein
LQKPFGERKRPVKSLDFRHRQLPFRPINGCHGALVFAATSRPGREISTGNSPPFLAIAHDLRSFMQ